MLLASAKQVKILPFYSCKATRVSSLSPLRLQCFRIRHESETFWSARIRFAVYTQNMNPESKLSGFVINSETIESGTRVETLYPDTYESKLPCSGNVLRIRIS